MNKIKKELEILGTLTNDKKEQLIGEIQFELNESDKCLKQMEMEVTT